LSFLLDTDVLIHLRDGDAAIWSRIRTLDPPLAVSIVSRVELENGVYRDPTWTEVRRRATDTILTQIATIDFGDSELAAYRGIVQASGYSRRNVRDRMIAATALAHDLVLVTFNGTDFQDAPRLNLENWASPLPTPPPSATPR
jgi:tRNA(fMet)-specific endonuclease VapC